MLIILGSYFIKHHKWGSPKVRIVFVSHNFKDILWADPKQLAKNEGKCLGKIKISDIRSIVDGLQSKFDPRNPCNLS